MTLKICLAGATGGVGRQLARAILAAPDLSLHSAVARRAARTWRLIAAGWV
jgi:4-hydroxy-tetrahydrodipicolinate reductase